MKVKKEAVSMRKQKKCKTHNMQRAAARNESKKFPPIELVGSKHSEKSCLVNRRERERGKRDNAKQHNEQQKRESNIVVC